MIINLKSVKTQLILYLACFAVFLAVKDRDAVFLTSTIIAVISAIAIESLILFVKTKAFRITESSIISGLIIGYVLSSYNALWIFILASAFAISSKHFIRLNKKHLFNPAAFGIFLSVILFGADTQWKGTYLWYILLPFGLYFVYKIKKIEITSGYIVVTLMLFAIPAVLQGAPLRNIFGYLNYFYIFVMVVEPKTSPFVFTGKVLFGIVVSVISFVMYKLNLPFDADLPALLMGNLIFQLYGHKKGAAYG